MLEAPCLVRLQRPARAYPWGIFPRPSPSCAALTRHLGGPAIIVKRDDLTGLAAGGNKTRKLEYLIADALNQGAATVITTGAAQSNHARQTAAAAARYGLGCVLVLTGISPLEITGNLLIDDLVGARIRWCGDRDADDVMLEVAAEERSAGRTPYIIPMGRLERHRCRGLCGGDGRIRAPEPGSRVACRPHGRRLGLGRDTGRPGDGRSRAELDRPGAGYQRRPGGCQAVGDHHRLG